MIRSRYLLHELESWGSPDVYSLQRDTALYLLCHISENQARRLILSLPRESTRLQGLLLLSRLSCPSSYIITPPTRIFTSLFPSRLSFCSLFLLISVSILLRPPSLAWIFAPFDGNHFPYVRYLSSIPFAHSFSRSSWSYWRLKLGIIFNCGGFDHILDYYVRWAGHVSSKRCRCSQSVHG